MVERRSEGSWKAVGRIARVYGSVVGSFGSRGRAYRYVDETKGQVDRVYGSQVGRIDRFYG